MKTRNLIPLFALLFGSVGCASNFMQTARTNGEGNFQFGVEPGVSAIATDSEFVYTPAFNISGRYGVSDSLDIGARIGSGGYELQSKLMLTDPNAMDSIAMAIAPTLTVLGGGGSTGGGLYMSSTIPFAVGIPLGDSELVIAPTLSPKFLFSSDVGGFSLAGGGSVGYAINFGGFTLLPEIALSVPIVAAAVSGDSSSSTGGGQFLGVAGGVGLLFGGRDKSAGLKSTPSTTSIP